MVLKMACVLALAAGSALGQENDRKVEAKLTLTGSYAFDADFKDNAGGVSVARGGGALNVAFPVFERSSLGVGLGTEYSSYDFEEIATMGPSPIVTWDDVLTTDVSVRFAQQYNDTCSWFGGLMVQAAGEEGADFNDSVTWGGTAGATYKVSETFTIGGAIAVRTRLEDDALVIPLLLVDWKISPTWRLSTFTGLNEAGLALGWEVCEPVTLSIGAAYALREFRLDDASTSNMPGGVGRDQGVPVWLGLEWRACEQLRVNVRGGLIAGREFTLDDAGGNEQAQEDIDATGFLEAGVTFLF